MAIPSSGQLAYSIVVHGSPRGVWRGRADPTPESAFHPGMVGNEPDLHLSNGVLRLERTVGTHSPASWRLREPATPVTGVAFPVGSLGAVLNDGDRLVVSRGGTGDLGVKVVRQDAAILGLGAVIGPFAPAIEITDDPRAHEERFYPVKRDLDDPHVTSLWLDVTDPDLDRVVEEIPDMAPGGRMVIAIAGGSADERSRLNQRLALGRRTSTSTWYVDVHSRFATEGGWRAYIQGLPGARPDDLYIRFTIDGVHTDLQEGHYRERPPWQLYAHKVYRWGIPGEQSHVAIVQASLGLSQAALLEATNQIASRRIRIDR